MANKFQKSVLERLEQEAVRQKQKVKNKEPEKKLEEKPAVEVTNENIEPVQIEPVIEQKTVTPQETEPETPALQEQPIKQELQILPDIGEYLRRDNQRLAKNKTFYLDNEVIEAIKTTAKTQSVTDSKLVNDILRRVLGLS